MKTLYSIVTIPYLVIFMVICLILFCPPMIWNALRSKREEKEIDENGEEKTTIFLDFQSMTDWFMEQQFVKIMGNIPKEAKVIISIIVWFFIFRAF